MSIMAYSKAVLCILFVALNEASSTTECLGSSTGECQQNFTTIGCLHEDCFEPVFVISHTDMTTSLCRNICASHGFYYTGLFNGTECGCANSPPCEGEIRRMADNICGVPCAGDINDFCGGRKAVHLYSFPGKHPAVGDWWFDGPRRFIECNATNILNIVVSTSIPGQILNGRWQLVTWATRNPYEDEAERYHEAALSLSLRDASNDTPLRTIPKKVRLNTDSGPSCDELRFLCVQLQSLDYSVRSTDPRPSCHEMTCEGNPRRRWKCFDHQCSCRDRLVNPLSTDEEKLAVINKVNITEDNVDEVFEEVESLSFDDFKRDEVVAIANIIEHVVALNSSDTKVTESVIAVIGNLMNSDPETLAAAQGKNQSNSRVMQALEHQLQVVDLTKNDGSFTSVQPNLIVQVQTTTPEKLNEGITFISRGSSIDNQLTDSEIEPFDHEAPTDSSDLMASVSVKTHFADDIDNTSVTSDIRIAFAVIRDPSLFISDVGNDRIGTYSSQRGIRRPNTPVISVTVDGSGRRKVKTEITSAFQPIEKSNGSVIIDDPICVFWDFETNDGTGGWSDYGCSMLNNGSDIEISTAIMCSCNHTTNFAVIMNFHSPKPSIIFGRASLFLSYIGCGVSIASLIITFAVYVLSPKLCQKQPNQIFMNVCLSLIFLYISYILVVTLNQQRHDVVESDTVVKAEKNVEIWCFCLAALVQYFTLTSLVWMAVEGVNMYLLFVKVLNARIPGFVAKASLIAWGLPGIIVVVTGGVARNDYVDPNLCFLAKTPKIGGLLCPIGLIIVANITIFTMVVVRLRRTIQTSSTKKNSIIQRVKEGQQRLQKAICIFLLLGLTWSSGYLLLIGTTFNHVFQIVFIILNSFQGFFIFVIYCLRQRVVRAELSRMCGCGKSKKRRSISLSSSSQRDDTTKTRQTEVRSTVIGRSHQAIELNISDTEDAGLPNRGPSFVEAVEDMESRQGRSSHKRKSVSSSTRHGKKRKSWLTYAEIREHLEEVLSRGRRSRKRKGDLSSECWAVGQQDKNRSLETRDGE